MNSDIFWDVTMCCQYCRNWQRFCRKILLPPSK